ncbi:glycosyltransferase family 69 protein [Phanerochaete carnosa HHB-10118-sp]|uniref:Glycosyltransferase family 69 protein n=1 Tax=Phanerochaete carnosa (strain HHB-10118-sp) TaxID=650164 RepID=K5WQC4_PHACS|nr:glycosyltransferase family 69 protein [Phanerochaete carnosa HHB-10118-sp]EKM61680.1 glycosyltransferase family 69 protein [Phanerochaete carnosa HHB-10118-sp]
MSKQLMLRLLGHVNWVVRRGGRFGFAVLKFPGVAEAITFAFLFHIATGIWCGKYCGIWEPGFPKLWTAWVLFLAVIPVFALLQLVWLAGLQGIVWLMNRRNRRCAPNSRRTSHDVEEEGYSLLRQQEGEDAVPTTPLGSPRSSSPPRRESKPSHCINTYSVFWWTRILVYVVLVFIGYHEYSNYEQPNDTRWRPALQKALSHKNPDPTGYAKDEKIFIAAAFYNNQDVLPYWTSTMLKVITYLGANNVYVSVVESNSSDGTPDLLRELDKALAQRNVHRRILISDTAIPRPPDMSWNNRIDFLAAVRNRALEPLVDQGGYDKVVFSNDVFIEPESLIELLETADGNYDMACALDFGHFGAYDMWVLRDRIGHLAAGIWPYFFDAADYEAMKTDSPVPVFSCWNGIVAFVADPVLPIHLRSNRTLSTSPLRHLPPPTHPLKDTVAESPTLTPPLKFRSAPRGEGCFHSESFLLPYDMRRIMGLERIYVNPRVITAYVWHFYVWFKWVLRHPFVKWFVERAYNGAWMQYARMIVGDDDKVYTWDGGDCHPWWYGDWW